MTQHLLHEVGDDFLLRLNGIEGALILETHPMVWSPSPFAIAMCELIAEDNISGKIVMDFAAGLGILGIVAGKRQAAKVIALDLNPHAISMAKHNWMLNNLDTTRFHAIESNCFDAIKYYPEIQGKINRIYSNPPTFPDANQHNQSDLLSTIRLNSGDWNRNGERGRIVTDALIVNGRNYLAPDGEILFIATSKQGAKLTFQMMETYWGKGIKADGNDPLDYSINWEDRGDANWAVVKRLNLRLANYYNEFLPLYKQMIAQGESDPVIEIDGELYQKLYFIRARKSN